MPHCLFHLQDTGGALSSGQDLTLHSQYQCPGAQAFTGELKEHTENNPSGLVRLFCMVMKHAGEPWHRALGGGMISALEHGAISSISSHLFLSHQGTGFGFWNFSVCCTHTAHFRWVFERGPRAVILRIRSCCSSEESFSTLEGRSLCL